MLEACLKGDQEAWKALVARYKNLVYSVPARYRMSPDDTADIFQQVWLTLYRELPRLRRRSALGAWLLTVTSRCCNKLRRSQAVVTDSSEVVLERLLAHEDDWRQTENEQVFREAVTRIPVRCRDLVRMLFYEDPVLSYAEAAERLGLAEGSIGFIRGRCLRKLKVELEASGWK